jgi:putative membrane protein
MYRHCRTSLGFAVGLLLAVMFSACGDRANRDETASGTGSASVGDTTAVATDTLAQPSASPDLTDANIVALLDHANEADSSAGALASKKATNAQVKKFAKMMMADHHQLRKQGAELAKKLSLTPEPPANDPVTPLAQQETAALEAAQKGPDFDRTYIQQEIAAHRAVLDLADQAHDSADNAELKALIEQARPLIENHLKQAEAIEKELGPTA